MQTLNLVEFLIKNGPPNTITTFKYELYQFKSLQGFSHYSDSTDRGEPSTSVPIQSDKNQRPLLSCCRTTSCSSKRG